MRVMTMLFIMVLLVFAAGGAWIMFGPQMAAYLFDSGETLEESKPYARRYAPYVILVPAEPLPDKSSSAPPSEGTSARKPEQAAAKAPEKSGTVERSPAPGALTRAAEPVAPPEPPRPVAPAIAPKPPPSAIAQQALEAVAPQQLEAAKKPPVAAAPKPAPPPEKQTAAAPAPKKETAAPPAPTKQPAALPAPAKQASPASQGDALKRGETRLKYEEEIAQRTEDKPSKKAIASTGTVRFRNAIPVSPGKLKDGSNTIALAGIEALGADSTCRYKSGTAWDCGRWGTFSLRRLIRGRSIVCEMKGEVSSTQALGQCSVGGTDINKWVVRRGWARPTAETQTEYADEMEAAKKDKIGQWSEESKEDS